jgi:hypothetical protein
MLTPWMRDANCTALMFPAHFGLWDLISWRRAGGIWMPPREGFIKRVVNIV